MVENIIPREKMNYTIDMLATMVVDELATELGKEPKDVLVEFILSKTGQALYTEHTKIWCNGPSYIVDMYKEEKNKY